MFILTNSKNEVIQTSNNVEERNEQYVLTDKNLAIPKEFKTQLMDGTIEVDKINLYEVIEIPEGVEQEKYCYTEKDGFYKNPNYRKYYSIEERLEMLEAIELERMMNEEE